MFIVKKLSQIFIQTRQTGCIFFGTRELNLPEFVSVSVVLHPYKKNNEI